MADEKDVTGSNEPSATQDAAPASPTDAKTTGEQDPNPAAKVEEQPQPTRKPGVPPPSYFVQKRQQERSEKQVIETIESLKNEVAELKRSRQAAPQEEQTYDSEPSQPAVKVRSDDAIREMVREEQNNLMRNQLQTQRESAANDWLSSQKHMQDPKFDEAVRKYLPHVQQQEAAMGFKSDPLYLAEKVYKDVAEYFGVEASVSAVGEAASELAARAAAPAPSGGSTADGSAAGGKVSASAISAKMVAAGKSGDMETFHKLQAERDKALNEGRLIP